MAILIPKETIYLAHIVLNWQSNPGGRTLGQALQARLQQIAVNVHIVVDVSQVGDIILKANGGGVEMLAQLLNELRNNWEKNPFCLVNVTNNASIWGRAAKSIKATIVLWNGNTCLVAGKAELPSRGRLPTRLFDAILTRGEMSITEITAYTKETGERAVIDALKSFLERHIIIGLLETPNGWRYVTSRDVTVYREAIKFMVVRP